MANTFSENILEQCGCADELEKILDGKLWFVAPEQRRYLFAHIQPLLHKAINATKEHFEAQ